MGVIYFYTGAIGFAAGIALSSLTVVMWPVVVWLLLLSFAVALLRYRSSSSAVPYVAVSIFLLLMALGATRFLLSEIQLAQTTLSQYEGQTHTITGVVVREPEMRERTQHLYVETTDATVLVRADRYMPIAYGDVVTVSGKLEKPDAFTTEYGRTFDYLGYLAARGVTHTISFVDIEVEATDAGNPVVASLLQFKQWLITSFQAVIPEPYAGLGAGLLLGVKEAMGTELERAFRATGVIHIVVLSGYNVMIVAEAIMRLLAVFLSIRARVVVGILAIAGFAIMVGLSATVVRASIMAGLVLIARATGRTYLVTRALILAALVMLCINPYLLLFDPGFQLSFLATLGLIFVAPKIEAILSWTPTTLQLREFVTATIATQITVLPLLLYAIGEFSVVAVVANVLILPIVPLAMGLTFLTGMLGAVSGILSSYVGLGAYWSLAYIIGIVEWLAALPFAMYVMPAFPVWVMLLAYVVLGYVAYRWWQATTVSSVVTPNRPESNDWVIEEEAVFTGENQKAGRARSSLPAEDTPIFFR